ncbi:MAG TPA: immunoglobulin domain-containing protein [Gemmataceae bacterium]|nr:immunoglobulin domain-containing protein [Gemmataceae bacterium]
MRRESRSFFPLRWWLSFRKRAQQKVPQRARSVRLRLEKLEDRITPTGPTLTALATFDGNNNGYGPSNGVVMDSSGNLYGTAHAPGSSGGYIIFELPQGTGTIKTLATLDSTTGTPVGSLILDSDGNLYGATAYNGVSGGGEIYELANGTITTLATFPGPVVGSGDDTPVGGLVMDSSGNLYGTSEGGGAAGDGYVFELAKGSDGYSKTITTLASFSNANEASPVGALILDSNGNLYGTTANNLAESGAGEVYELAKGSDGYTITELASFTGSGETPSGGLVMDSSGNLYGISMNTYVDEGDSTIYELAKDSDSYTMKRLAPNIGLASANLVVDSRGDLYGTTPNGGIPYDSGTVFELAKGSDGYSNTITTLASFNQSTTGYSPGGEMVLDSSGNLYGAARSGGSSGLGTIFEVQDAASPVLHMAFVQQPSNTASGATMPSVTVALEDPSGNIETSDNSDTISLALSPSGTLNGTTTMTVSGGEATFSNLSINQIANSYTLVASTDASGVSSLTSNSFNIIADNVTTTANNVTAVLPTAQSVSLSASVADASVPIDTVDEGAVTFTVKNGETVLGTPVQGSVSGGTASASFTLPEGVAPGSYTIAVSYSDSQDNFTDSGDTNATLTLQQTPSVTTNPSNQTVTAGQNATFTVAASGYPTPTAQWQVSTDGGKTWTDISGATSTTLMLTNVQVSQNGYEYQAVFTNSAGTATSNAATLTVQQAPIVTTQPTDQSTTMGNTATFTAAASGNPTPTVQWQVSADGGNTFSDISGATSTTLILSNVALAMSGYEYQAVFSNSLGTTTSNAATLSVQAQPTAPTVTTQPTNQTVSASGTATFAAAANGTPTPTVEWQVSTDGGNTWTDISGATSTTLTLSNVQASQNGYEYQAIFTNSAGTATTNTATLTVQQAPSVTTQPTDQSVTVGSTATFTAAASGDPTPTVQWQVSTDSGQTWTNISGAISTTLTLTNVQASQNGSEYQAVFINSAGSATSNAATLTVQQAPSVTTQPTDQTVTAGGTATFTTAASGTPTPTVQWQVSTDSGNTWTNINGATSTTLTLTNVQVSQNGSEYQAVFTNSAGTATSNAVTLTVQQAPSVTTQPTDQTVTAGQNATFTAATSGFPSPTVQWQVSTDGGNTWTDINGATSTTLTLTNVQVSQNGSQYQAVFTNNAGEATSNAVTLTVQQAPTVTTQPTDQSMTVGSTATFTAAAGGNPTPTVKWQVSTDAGNTWTDISGATSTTLTLSNVDLAMSGYEYQAVFSNSIGTATTNTVTLTVQAQPTEPTVATQPTNQTVTAGGTATFTAAASGDPTPTVQWQVSIDAGNTWSDISGATSTTLTLDNVASVMNGYEYQGIFTNSAGTATTNAATLTVQTQPIAPTVTTQPTNQTVTAGATATFTTAASGTPTPTVQWQVSTNVGQTWTDISGATSTTLTLSDVQASQNGYEYQAIFTNSAGTATSNAATLTVQAQTTTPTVTTQPTNQSTTVGGAATFTAASSGDPTPTVQWQVSTSGGNNWTDISGATSTTLTLSNVLSSQNGDEYRAIFSNSVGTAMTNAAFLTVQTSPSITSGDSIAFTVGQSGSFLVIATGSPTPLLTVSGALPSGVTFADNGNGTATLGGTPAAGTNGTYHFTITAHNGAGSDARQSFTLTINPASSPPPPPPTATSSSQPPPLDVPPVLTLINEFVGGIETVNANDTETITYSIFGITLLAATYDDSGNFMGAAVFGINVPSWVWFM